MLKSHKFNVIATEFEYLDRIQAAHEWLSAQFPGQTISLTPASSDASFRRYFRFEQDGGTRILMDAPPPQEDCRPFVHVAKLFEAAGAHVPHVIAQDLERGFLLLSDLGNQTYLNALSEENAEPLYRDAIDTLIKIQLASRPGELPAYDDALLTREVRLFPDWYVARHKGMQLPVDLAARMEQVFRAIVEHNLAEPQVYVHRDYHSRNLMVSAPNPGVLDFQDAVYGPISYDLASLFKDAYIQWEEQRVLDWLIRYWEQARKAGLPVRADFADFYRDFEWMGAQRHIKVLGIFARLCHRDGKDNYLNDMPLVSQYLRKTCRRYRELGPLLSVLDYLEVHDEVQVGYTF